MTVGGFNEIHHVTRLEGGVFLVAKGEEAFRIEPDPTSEAGWHWSGWPAVFEVTHRVVRFTAEPYCADAMIAWYAALLWPRIHPN